MRRRILLVSLGAGSAVAVYVAIMSVLALELGWEDGPPGWVLFGAFGVSGVLASRWRGSSWLFLAGQLLAVAAYLAARGAPWWYCLSFGGACALAGLAGVLAVHTISHLRARGTRTPRPRILGCWLIAVAVAPLAACRVDESVRLGDEPSVRPAPGARIERAPLCGTVIYHGEPPASFEYLGDPLCASEAEAGRLRDERVLVDHQGRLANVLVFVKTGAPRDAQQADGTHAVDMVSCAFRPRMSGLRLGQELLMSSEDQTLHHFRVHSAINRSPGCPQFPPIPGSTQRWRPRKPEPPFQIRCDVHAWERASVGVFDHPFYAVTDARGEYAFSEPLPPGTYTLVAWHELLGERSREIVVADELRERQKPQVSSFEY